MDNLTADAAVNAVSEKLGLNMATNSKKQVGVYVTASIVLNGFLDIFTGTTDLASLLSGINLHAFSLAQIKHMTEQINKNMTTLMEADGKAAWDHFKRGEFKEAHDRAIKGFQCAPNKIESGIPIKLMCTRIKLMTELISKDEGDLFFERNKKPGLIIQTCLDELLDDPLVKELWERATSRLNPIKSPSFKLIAHMDDLVGGCYATMSHSLGWTIPNRILQDGEIAYLNTKYLPLEENRIIVPISQHYKSFTSMEVFKYVDKILHVTITVTDNKKGVHQKYEITEKSVNGKPSKFSCWALKLKNNQYTLSKITDINPSAGDFSLECTNEYSEPDKDCDIPKHSNCESNSSQPGSSEETEMVILKNEGIKNIDDINGGYQTPENKNSMIDEEDVEKNDKCKKSTTTLGLFRDLPGSDVMPTNSNEILTGRNPQIEEDSPQEQSQLDAGLPTDIPGSHAATAYNSEQEMAEARKDPLEHSKEHELFEDLKEEIKGTWILDHWEQILNVFIPFTEKANKTVWAIKELHNLGEVTDMALDAIHMIHQQRNRALSKVDFETVQRKFTDNLVKEDHSNISKVLLLAASGISQKKNLPSDLGYNRLMIMKQFWKSVMRKLLPDYPALIEAIQFLHTYDGTELSEVSALAAFQQIKRFSKMGVTSMSQFHTVIEELSNCSNQMDGLVSIQSFNQGMEVVEYQYALYDVILTLEMPSSEKEKGSMMSAIKDYLESIKTDICLQNYVIRKQNSRSIEAIDWTNKFDWDDIQIEVIDIFFGLQTHCLIKIRTNNPMQQYDLTTIQNMNLLIKLHIESIDTFTKRKFKIQNTNNWRGANTGEISVKLTWEESIFKSMFGGQSKKEDIEEAAMDIIRKIPSEMKSDEQKRNLKEKLTNEYGIFPRDVDELFKWFEMIPAMNERDSSEIGIELSWQQRLSPMKTISTNIPLWPYMERKLNEIDDAQIRTGFKSAISNADLPESISKELINNVEMFRENEELYDKVFEEDAKDGYPFNTIFNIFRDHGGTFGGWITALEKLRDDPKNPSKRAFQSDESRIEVLESIISQTMDRYNDWYKRWEAHYECLPKLITNYDEFVKKFTSHGIGNFERMCQHDLTCKLEVADQIWLFRERFGGYAHVLFYLGHFAEDNGHGTFDPHHYVVHTHRNIGPTTYKGNSRIQKDKLKDVIGESDRCFIIRMSLNSEEKEEARKRALACVNPELDPIIFSYNGYSGNCESCVNAFFGLWDDEVTSEQGRDVASGSASMSMKTIAKTLVSVTKRGSDDDLRDKMKARFQQQQLDTHFVL